MIKRLLANWDWLSTILIAAVILRFWNLHAPSNIVFDEFHYVPAAKILVGVDPHPGMKAWFAYPLIVKSPDINFSHPPLGKFIIGAGIKLFGDRGIGWRFFSAIFGTLSLIVFFVLALELFKDRFLANLATFFLSFDFMHVVQSRIAMLDVFLVFFVLVTVLALVKLAAAPQRKLWAVLAALSMALAVSSKYNAVLYILAGYGVFWILSSQPWRQKAIYLGSIGIGAFALYSLWAIYYHPFGYSYAEWLRYHLAVSRETLGPLKFHGYGSSPFEWLFNSKPILYHFNRAGSKVSVIYALGHPVIWLAGLLGSFVLFAEYRAKHRKTDLILMIWFLMSYVPLIFVLWRRQGFLYHMLPAVPVICLIVARSLTILTKKRAVIYSFCAAVVLGAVIGFPIMTGAPMPEKLYGLFVK